MFSIQKKKRYNGLFFNGTYQVIWCFVGRVWLALVKVIPDILDLDFFFLFAYTYKITSNETNEAKFFS